MFMMSKADSIFAANLKRLALVMLPTWLRRPLTATLIYSGVTPLNRMLGQLRMFRKDTTYRLTHNGQVCSLRSMLNDEFDPLLRRIKIEDQDSSALIDASEVRLREEGKWVMLPQRGEGVAMIYRTGFNGTSGFDFWLNVPHELNDNENEARMRALVNMYKLASKRYTITYQNYGQDYR